MILWKLTLSYDGSSFHGWQVQPDRPTVQGTLAAAIERITGERVLPQGSGRTDAGVHALAQVATFALDAPIPPANLQRALNRSLPPSIRVLDAEIALPGFHARHSALRKTYEYRVFERRSMCGSMGGSMCGSMGRPMCSSMSPISLSRLSRHGFPEPAQDAAQDRICPPFLAPFVWDCPWPLDLEPMQRAAALLLGTHDFTSFAASDPDLTLRASDLEPNPGGPFMRRPLAHEWGADAPTATISAPNPIKTIFASACLRESGLLLYRITGSGFLHHMVRNIVGTLIEIGRGSLPFQEIPNILAKKDRSTAGPTAPAHGLFLVSVEYGRPEQAASATEHRP